MWLEALKCDQTTPETFYQLAVWYRFKLDDVEKAKKCIGKALMLKPDFEPAFLLMAELLTSSRDVLDMLNRVLSVNPHMATAFYLKGLVLKNQGDFTQAIENLQNATKFYTLDHQKSKITGLKQRYPQLAEVVSITGKPLALLSSRLGMFGLHPNLCVSAWVLLTDCFSRIDKP